MFLFYIILLFFLLENGGKKWTSYNPVGTCRGLDDGLEINLSVRSINFEYHSHDPSGNINWTLLVEQCGTWYEERAREREREREGGLLISQRGTEVLTSNNRKLNVHRAYITRVFYDPATMVYRLCLKRASADLSTAKGHLKECS